LGPFRDTNTHCFLQENAVSEFPIRQKGKEKAWQAGWMTEWARQIWRRLTWKNSEAGVTEQVKGSEWTSYMDGTTCSIYQRNAGYRGVSNQNKSFIRLGFILSH
jgi:hypothetical protein